MGRIIRMMFHSWGQAFRMPGLIALFYLLNLCTAIALAIPFTLIFRSEYEGTSLSYQMFDSVSFPTFVEFRELHFGEVARAAIYTSPLILALFLLQFIAVGGVLQRLSEKQRIPWSAFAACAVRRLPQILIIEVAVMILGAIVVALPSLGMTELIDRFDEDAISPWPALMLIWLRAAIVLITLAWTLAARDYMRAALVAGPGRGVWRAMGSGLHAVTLRIFPTMTLWIGVVWIAWIFAIAFAVGSSFVLQETWQHLAGAFALAQVAVIIRVIGNFARMAAAYTWLDDEHYEAGPVTEAELMPGNPLFASGVESE